MNSLPGGTVTFLMTDVEQSTRLWEHFPDRMRAALLRHDALAQTCIARHGGTLVKPRGEGDSLFAVFEQANAALNAAVDFYNALRAETWDSEVALRVRMALHTGEAGLRDQDYYGATVNRCARIRSVAHGEQILLSETTADLTRGLLPADARLRDLGTHGLKDLRQPERLSQLLCPDWRDNFPPLHSLDAYRHNLPRQLTSFIEREDEMAQIKTLLADTCLLTLMGSGGSGKTRLALQVGADVIDAYEDGVWLVELASFSDPNLIAREIAKSLSCREEPGRHALETLCGHLKSKSVLLILDNCEHLVAEAAQAANTLLKACPRLRILATSRIRLNVPGETAWRVPSLLVPDDDARADVDAAMRHASLRLFVERAASAHPQFAVTKANLSAVTQICRRLDGIPLAIELAAARVNALTVQQIAKRLDRCFSLLVGGSSAVLERHQTLRALIDWSHDLLSLPERVLLRRLAVFKGGWTLEGAEAVCAWGEIKEDDVFELLSRLVDASLVIADEQEDAHRYRLLETVRQYAQEQMDKVEEDTTARDNHLRYFLDLAEEAEPHLQQAGQKTWLARLEAEHDNLRAGLQWAMDGTTRLRLVCALCRFWSMRSYFEEGRSWLRGTLARANDAPPRLRAKALNGLGLLATRQSDYAEARRSLEASLDLRQNLNDGAGMAETLNNLANLATAQGQGDKARDLFAQSLRLAQSVGDTQRMAAALNNLGILFVNAGEYEAARDHFERSLAIYRERDDRATMASVLGNLGVVCCHLEDYAQSRQYYEEGLALDLEHGDRWGTAIWLHNLGDVARKQKDFASASHFLHQCLNLCMVLDDKTGTIRTLDAYVEAAWEAGWSDQAIVLSSAAATLREATGILASNYAQQQNARILAEARHTLAPTVYDECWSRGGSMTPEQVSSYIITNNQH